MADKKPIAIVTKSGEVLGMGSLDNYVLNAKTKQIPDDLFNNLYGQMGLVQPYYSFERMAYLLEINVYHANCVRVKAQDTVGQGWELKPAERIDNPSESQLEVAKEVLENQQVDLVETLRRMMTDYEGMGNGYLEIGRQDDRPDGPVVFISHIPGQTVRIESGFNKFCQLRSLKYAWFRKFGYKKDVNLLTGDEGEPGTVSTRGNELIPFSKYTSRTDYYGMPEALPAVGAMLGSALSRDYNIKFFENFGVPAFVVSVSGDYDLGELDEHGKYKIQKTVEGYFRTMQREPHSNMLLMVPSEAGGKVEVEIKPLSVDIKEASFRLYRRDNRDEIISSHRVPPYRIGIAETGSLGGSTADKADEIYVQSIINPNQKMIERAINRLILPTLGVTDWRFVLNDVDLDQESRDMEVAGFMVQNGAMTPNQLIRYFGPRFGLQPSDNTALDDYYINGMPIGYVRGQGFEPTVKSDAEPEAIAAVKQFHERLEGMISRGDA